MILVTAKNSVRTRRPGWLLGLLAALLVLLLTGTLLNGATLAQAWLVTWITLATPALGALALLMVHGLTGGDWGDESRYVWRSLAASLPVLCLALLPLLLGMQSLFPWTAPPETLPEVVRHKLAYLNEPFFVIRTLVYLATWSYLGWWATRDKTLQGNSSGLHAAGLIVWALTVTFFCYDWLMSIEPSFYSDIYGLEVMAICVTTALALGLAVGAGSLRPAVRLDLANLWLSVLLGWAFVAFSQLIIIWSGNLPHEIHWYLARGEGAWLWIGRVSVGLYLVIPFAMLLPTAAKRRGSWLHIAASVCLAGHVLHIQWLVWPAFSPSHWGYVWCVAAVLMLGSLWLAWLSHVPPHRPSSTRIARESHGSA